MSINNKKIISISIITLILLTIGITYAYFSASISSTTNSVASTEEISLTYSEDTLYTISGLIPSTREYAIKGASRANGYKCKDDNNHAVCSLYEFTVTNEKDIAQKLSIYMTPIINEYTNLKFIVYETSYDNITESTTPIMDTVSLKKDSTSNVMLNNTNPIIDGKNSNNNSITYTVLFYIENLDYDQTEDMAKIFTAGINVNSLTLGTFVSGNFGETCWSTTQLDSANHHSLTSFNGLYESGEIKEECASYISDDALQEGYQYTINVPGNIGGKIITTVGDYLFYPNSIDLSGNNVVSNSLANGVDSSSEKIIPSLLSTTLLGDNETSDNNIEVSPSAINYTNIVSINIEEGILFIGTGSFANLNNLSSINLSNTLLTIGNDSFSISNITSITIPFSVMSIGKDAFLECTDLSTVIFNKNENGISNLKIIGENSFAKTAITNIEIPSSVITIGNRAFFSITPLTTLTFNGAIDRTSKLETIGENAFSVYLTYLSGDNPLIIPESVTSIGIGAFIGRNLKYIKPLAGNIYGDTWYNSTYTTILP